MSLTLEEIFCYLKTDKSKNTIKQGLRIVLSSGNLFHCGKNLTKENNYEITARCLAVSSLHGETHEIKGSISNAGKINKMKCSCKAGEGEKCKHIAATLLHCVM